jgi:hypothetical protein
MTDHGRGVADGSFVGPDFCGHFVLFIVEIEITKVVSFHVLFS